MTDYIVFTNDNGDYLHIAIKWECNIARQGIPAILEYLKKCRWNYPLSLAKIAEWHGQGFNPREL